VDQAVTFDKQRCTVFQGFSNRIWMKLLDLPRNISSVRESGLAAWPAEHGPIRQRNRLVVEISPSTICYLGNPGLAAIIRGRPL
jgi:hypothetical protein